MEGVDELRPELRHLHHAGPIRNSKIADALGPSMLRVPGDPTTARLRQDAGRFSTVIPGCVPLDISATQQRSINASQINGWV